MVGIKKLAARRAFLTKCEIELFWTFPNPSHERTVMFSAIRNLLTTKANLDSRTTSKRRMRLESLEDRAMLTAVVMTDYDQLMLELVNRARANPAAEVALNPLVSDLNQGLSAGTISSTPKQPLASLQPLVDAGRVHALDMLENNYFEHNSLNGDTPTDRAADQGYVGSVGENIAWNGSTGPIDYEAETQYAHRNLFFSPSHRVNLMNEPYDHAGMAVEFGEFTHEDGRTYNSAMVAQEYGFNSGGNPYLTGVVYSDTVLDDDFFSVGESESGVRITAVDSQGVSYFTHSGPSGGYNLELPAGTYTVTAFGGVLDQPMVSNGVVIGTDNVKVDFETSASPQDAQEIVGFNTGEEFWVGESNGSSLDTAYYGDWPSTTTYEIIGVGDMNGDGLDDIVGRAANDGTLRVAISTGQSTFASSDWGSLTTVTSWSNIFVGDFNGDGLDDVMGRADSDGTFWLAESNGNAFSNSYWGRFTSSVNWTTMLALDLNGDGKQDITGRAQDGTWWSGISTGSSLQNSHWGKWSTNVEWTDISVGDFNGDGLDDVAGRGNNAYWWVSNSTGTNYATQYWATWTSTVTWEDVSIGDYDGDGLDDIAGRANGQWWLAISHGSGFSNHYWGYWTTSTTWSDVAMIDLNADGKDDLIGRAANGQWWLFQSTGSNFAASLAATWSAGASWSNVSVGNFI